MDQIKIGKFIASCRKEIGMTQADLAEKFNISDRAVSKWETGRSLPDSSIMLELCETLNITVNELLSGEKIMNENYDKKAEENLINMKKEIEERDKRLLAIEYIAGIPVVVVSLALCFVATCIEMPIWLSALMIALGVAMLLTFSFIAIRIEQKAGYYECQKCHHMYVPTYWQTLFAMHSGRTRYMKCPNCHKRSWNKKRVSKD